ncbi:hypothetical protein D1872_37420 [compost metagenome]
MVYTQYHMGQQASIVYTKNIRPPHKHPYPIHTNDLHRLRDIYLTMVYISFILRYEYIL